MTPALNTVVRSDALALCRELPEASVDAIITDPPYGLTELDFDQPIDLPAFWHECWRLLRSPECPVVVFSQQPFTTELIASARKQWRFEIIWEKSMAVGFLDAADRPLRAHENIEVFSRAAPAYFPQMKASVELRTTAHRKRGEVSHYGEYRSGVYIDNGTRYPRSVWKYAQRNTAFKNTKSYHPTSKPVPLMEELMLTFTRPGALIFDPYCGGGSTGIAARNTGRNYIIGDHLQKWVDVARARLAAPYTPPLFDLDAPAAPKAETLPLWPEAE